MVANDATPSTIRYNEKPVYTTSNGAPVQNPSEWQRPGSMGPLLLQDFHLIDLLAHFDRASTTYPSLSAQLAVCGSLMIYHLVACSKMDANSPF
jgi:hypothetical protein